MNWGFSFNLPSSIKKACWYFYWDYTGFINSFRNTYSVYNTVVPRYSSSIHSNEWQASDERWGIISCGVASWFTQTLVRVTDKWWASTERWNIFSHQNGMRTRFDEFWSWRVPRYHCILHNYTFYNYIIYMWYICRNMFTYKYMQTYINVYV